MFSRLRGARRLAPLPGPARRDGRRRRPHVRPGAQPRASTWCCRSRRRCPSTACRCGSELRALPLDEQKRAAAGSRPCEKLIAGARRAPDRRALGTEARQARLRVDLRLSTASRARTAPWPRSRASAASIPAEAMIDLALEKDIERFFLQPVANEDQDNVLEMMRHPRAVVTFSDSGAHVSPDHGLLAADPPAEPLGARAAGVHAGAGRADADPGAGHALGLRRSRARPRGLRRRPARLRSRHDRPRDARSGQRSARRSRRLVQRARGIAATVVNGEVCCGTASTPGPSRVGCSAVPTPGARPCEPDYQCSEWHAPCASLPSA